MTASPPRPGRTLLVHVADQRRSRTDSHGIINLSVGLLHALPEAMHDTERLVVLANDELAGELRALPLRPADELRVLPAPGSTWRRLWLDHVQVLREAERAGADVVLFPKGFLPLRPRRHGPRLVPIFHDDIPQREVRRGDLPVRRRVRFGFFAALGRWSLQRADVRLFVSAFTAERLTTAAGRARRPTDAVVHEGITLPRLPVQPLARRRPQAVVLGSTHRHKRIAAGLELIAGDPTMTSLVERVVVTGALPSGTRPVPLPVVHRPGPLTGEELASLIAESRVLVFPSEYEGFGLPPIEAFALGTPAIYRRTGAAAEVLAGYPGGFDDERPGSFARAVGEVAALDDAALGELSDRAWSSYRWSAVAARVLSAIRAAVPPR